MKNGKNGNGNGMVCHDTEHGCCCYGGYSARHVILRIILALGLLGFVFAMGLKLGQLKTRLQFYNDYGAFEFEDRHHYMMWKYRDPRIFIPSAPMPGTTAPAPASATEESY